MKRSEMTKLMTDHWFGLFPNESHDYKELYEEVRHNMGNLLDWQIHKGMLAPSIKNPKFTCGHHNATNPYYIHEWEPEDET